MILLAQPKEATLPCFCAQVFNMSNPQTVYKDLESPLKFQTRCVTCFPDSTGYLVRANSLSVNLMQSHSSEHVRMHTSMDLCRYMSDVI